jgi:hypothetical protein
MRALQAAIDPSGEGNAATLASIGGRSDRWFCAMAGDSDRLTGRLARRASTNGDLDDLEVHRSARAIANRHRVKGNVLFGNARGPGGRGARKVRNLRPGPDLEPVAGETRHRCWGFQRMVRRCGNGIGRGEWPSALGDSPIVAAFK